jgi:cAMP-dependent protein kinase regulator
LTDEQRAAIADCLALETFKFGEKINSQDEPVTTGSKFYIVHEGQVQCFRAATGASIPVRVFNPGDVFGEVALLNHGPRQADCIAATTTATCLTMTRDAFERLMGPLKEKLSKQAAAYLALNANCLQ